MRQLAWILLSSPCHQTDLMHKETWKQRNTVGHPRINVAVVGTCDRGAGSGSPSTLCGGPVLCPGSLS